MKPRSSRWFQISATFSLSLNPIDVHAGERGRLSGWLNVAPLGGRRPSCRPRRGDEVVFAKHEVDTPAEIREGSTKVSRDLRHARRARKRMCGTEVDGDRDVGGLPGDGARRLGLRLDPRPARVPRAFQSLRREIARAAGARTSVCASVRECCLSRVSGNLQSSDASSKRAITPSSPPSGTGRSGWRVATQATPRSG